MSYFKSTISYYLFQVISSKEILQQCVTGYFLLGLQKRSGGQEKNKIQGVAEGVSAECPLEGGEYFGPEQRLRSYYLSAVTILVFFLF